MLPRPSRAEEALRQQSPAPGNCHQSGLSQNRSEIWFNKAFLEPCSHATSQCGSIPVHCPTTDTYPGLQPQSSPQTSLCTQCLPEPSSRHPGRLCQTNARLVCTRGLAPLNPENKQSLTPGRRCFSCCFISILLPLCSLLLPAMSRERGGQRT